jgi:hypothetical protein
MEFKDGKAILTDEEANETGFPAEMELSYTALFGMRCDISTEDQRISALQADGDVLSSQTMAEMYSSSMRQAKRWHLVSQFTLQLMSKEYLEYVDGLPTTE